MKNKVLIVASHYRPNIGGVETHLEDLVQALNRRKWQVVVATYSPLARKTKASMFEKKKNLTIYRMPWLGFNIVHKLSNYPVLEFIYLFPGLFLVIGFSLLKNLDVKAIHAQGLVPAVASLIWAKATGKKIIMSTHNLYFFPKNGLYTWFSKIVLSQMDEILCLSLQSEKEIKSIGVKPSIVHGYRYWLDLEVFKPVTKSIARKNLKLKSTDFIIFFVGRLIETKGVKLLLNLSMKNEFKNIKFVFGGVGPLSSEIESHTTPNVLYVSSLNPQQVREYMSAADIVSVPSLVDEGYGRVAMEAIATGAPVLASKKGGLVEAINEEIGWLVEPTVTKFLKVLKEILKDKDQIVIKKKKCRKYAINKFSEKNVETIINSYLQ